MNDNMFVPVAGNGLLPLRALNRRQLLAGIGAGALALPSAALAAGGRPLGCKGRGRACAAARLLRRNSGRVAIGSGRNHGQRRHRAPPGASRAPSPVEPAAGGTTACASDRPRDAPPAYPRAGGKPGFGLRPSTLPGHPASPRVLDSAQTWPRRGSRLVWPPWPCSQSEWVGVPTVLLEEAGLKRGAAWVIAEGADAAAMSGACPSRRPSTTPLSRSIKTGSGSARRTATPCDSSCRTTKGICP